MFKFDHHRLDAYTVAREALRLGDGVAHRLPRGHRHLSDQLRRALLAAFLGIAEGSSRTGTDRVARFRCARGEAAEAAAALEAVALLGLAPLTEVNKILSLLDRLCAMLTRLGGLTRAHPETVPAPPTHPHHPQPPSNPNSNPASPSDSVPLTVTEPEPEPEPEFISPSSRST